MLFVTSATADPTRSINGVVRDLASGEVIAGAHVFVLESTLGTVTDESGQFILTDLSEAAYKLGVSMLGYKPYTMQVDLSAPAAGPLQIDLVQQVYQMDQVMITGKKNRRWKKQLRKFEQEILGDSENAQKTHIVNPEVLDFIQRKDVLLARAYEPLIIENQALGYRIYYDLVHCAIQHGQPRYKGIARFEEMEPANRKQQRRWEKNRKIAYQGSFKHLLQTLATGKNTDDLRRAGFTLALTPEFPSSFDEFERAIQMRRSEITDIVSRAEHAGENLLRFNKYLLISYADEFESTRYIQNHLMHSREPDVQRSSIELRTAETIFHSKGYLYDTYSVVLHGYMGWERMAEMLPLDYVPADG